MLLTDISLQLPSQFLAEIDRATMAPGMEAHVSLLDERVASLSKSGCPQVFKVCGPQRQIVLRDAMRARLAAEILDGPRTWRAIRALAARICSR
jgi:hypothetical protein